MNDDFQFLRAKTLSMEKTRSRKPADVIPRVMRHNLREIQAEYGTSSRGTIDPRRIQFNEVIFGPDTSDAVAEAAQAAMQAAGVKPRKNAAMGIELVVSLPAETRIDTRTYFVDAMRWAQQFFAVPLLSAVIHADEDYPHAHIVLLPLRDGRLIATELLGDRKATKAMQTDFHEKVGKRYGLRLPRPQQRHSAAVRRDALQLAFDVLERNGCGIEPAVLWVMLEACHKNPEPLLKVMGLAMPQPGETRSFAEIMTRPCAPEKPNRCFGNQLIGVLGSANEGADEPEKQNTYALLGVSISTPAISPPGPTSASTSPPTDEDAGGTASTDDEPAAGEPLAVSDHAHAANVEASPANRDSSYSTGHIDYANHTADEGSSDQAGEPVNRFTRERDSEQRADEWDAERGEWRLPGPAKPSRRALTAIAIQRQLDAIKWQSVETKLATEHF